MSPANISNGSVIKIVSFVLFFVKFLLRILESKINNYE